MTTYAADIDNDTIRASIIAGTVDPRTVNIRELMREVVEQRDAARVGGGL